MNEARAVGSPENLEGQVAIEDLLMVASFLFLQRSGERGALCVEMYFTWTFPASSKCNKRNSV